MSKVFFSYTLLFDVCGGSLSCLKTHNLWLRQISDTRLYILLQNALIVFWFLLTCKDSKHPVPKAARQLQNMVFFSLRACSFVNIGLVWFRKKTSNFVSPIQSTPSQKDCDLSTSILAKFTLTFLWLPLQSGAFLGLLPFLLSSASSFSSRQQWIV